MDHGIQDAYYLRTALGLEPVLECVCGETFMDSAWEYAGHAFDVHLAQTKDEEDE